MNKLGKTKEQIEKEESLFQEEMVLVEEVEKLATEIKEKLGEDALKPLAEMFDKGATTAEPLSEGGMLPTYRKLKALALDILNHSAE